MKRTRKSFGGDAWGFEGGAGTRRERKCAVAETSCNESPEAGYPRVRKELSDGESLG